MVDVREMYQAGRAAVEAGWIIMESAWLGNASEDAAVGYVLDQCERHEDVQLNVADALGCEVGLLPQEIRRGVQVAKRRLDLRMAQQLADRFGVEA